MCCAGVAASPGGTGELLVAQIDISRINLGIIYALSIHMYMYNAIYDLSASTCPAA